MRVELWADGSGTITGDCGGWAFVLRALRDDDTLISEVVESGSVPPPDATNNRMELTAVIEGLSRLTRPTKLTVFSDSEYVVLGYTRHLTKWWNNGWRASNKKPVANRDLWEKLTAIAAGHDISWEHVRGHSGVPLNEVCDKLAGEARHELKQRLKA